MPPGPECGRYAGVGGLYELCEVGGGVEPLQRVRLQPLLVLLRRAQHLAVPAHSHRHNR